MNIQSLKDDLNKRYSVMAFVDLNDTVADPTVGYQCMKDNHKQSFDPTERIVFFADNHVGPKTIAYLRHAADIYDISRCFILVACPSHDTTVETGDLEFLTHSIINGKFSDDAMMSTSTICALPWFHVEYMNQGKIYPCCNSSMSRSSEGYASVIDFFSSQDMKDLRQDLLQGRRPSSCQQCWLTEDNGLESLRQWRTKSHRDEFFTQRLSDPKITSLVMRPSIVCNFKCRICSSRCSSQWLQEEYSFASNINEKKKIAKLIDQSRWFDKDERYQEDFFKILPDLEYIDIYGGEPLLIKQLDQVLDICIDHGSSSKQTLHFNTNGSVFPEKTIEKMHFFKKVAISISIDDIGPRFEITRGGVWSEIESNVKRFKSCDPDIFVISLLITVSNLNLLYLDEIVDWAEKNDLPWTFNMLAGPEYLRFDKVSETVSSRAIEKYRNHHRPILQNIAATLLSKDAVDSTHWVKEMQKMDDRRGQDMTATHPELCLGMGYVRNH